MRLTHRSCQHRERQQRKLVRYTRAESHEPWTKSFLRMRRAATSGVSARCLRDYQEAIQRDDRSRRRHSARLDSFSNSGKSCAPCLGNGVTGGSVCSLWYCGLGESSLVDKLMNDPKSRRYRLADCCGSLVAATLFGLAIEEWVWPLITRDKSPPQIAIIGPKTGNGRNIWKQVTSGVTDAQVEDQHGKLLRPDFDIELEFYDNGGGAEKTIEIAKELAKDRSVLAVIGPGSSTAAKASLPVYREHRCLSSFPLPRTPSSGKHRRPRSASPTNG